jgi:DNA-binding NarL/FixJ family response regulator
MEERNWVMVVDDDRTCLDMIEEVITDDYNVLLATSGEQAMGILLSGKIPDLILLDIVMQGMDGYETFMNICDVEELSGIPVIFLTGKSNSADELAGLELGAQDYIMKPFIREVLLARIRLRIENGRQARQLHMLQKSIQRTNIDEDRFRAMSRKLTLTEQKVARLIKLGCNNREISLKLSYSTGYVKNLISRIYNKLNVKSRCEFWRLFKSQ